jgi:hypothetical protein
VSRIVCQFSCGAASAVATKLAIAEYGTVLIVNAFVAEEHADNRRFLADCEHWFGQAVTVVRDEKYGASVQEVWRRRRFIIGQGGASCRKAVKTAMLDAVLEPDDVMVLGYTIEEAGRLDDFIDANNSRRVLAPLIERGLTKADCLAIVERAGIELPLMYRLGYGNANCIGCCKGGEGYWNKIRIDFPPSFEAVAQIQDTLGPGSYFFRDRTTGERISLRALDPEAGRHDAAAPECSFFCELAEKEFA